MKKNIMIMEEATEKYCPFAFASNGKAGYHCVAEGCMAWQQVKDKGFCVFFQLENQIED